MLLRLKLIRNLPLTYPPGFGFCDLCRGVPARSIDAVAPARLICYLTDLTVHLARSHGSIVEDLEAVLSQLKLARCPHSFTASLAALPSMSLIPIAPFAAIAADLKK